MNKDIQLNFFSTYISRINFPRIKSFWFLFCLFFSCSFLASIFFIDSYSIDTINNESININVNDIENSTKIAIVSPTFTSAAYDSFYDFFRKHIKVKAGQNITSDLNLLFSKVTNKTKISSSSSNAIAYMYGHLMMLYPHIDVEIIKDQDVHFGKVFNKNKENLYDILILFHNEYVTQNEYDNLKKYVSNGGKIIFTTSNALYAEVKYYQDLKTISLVKGHSWAFNNVSAWKSVNERWLEENSEWVGSNYASKCKTFKNYKLSNNPFEYNEHEEQIITNVNARILLDFNFTVHTESNISSPIDPSTCQIAAYEMDYKKGKVIHIGIYSDKIIFNKNFNLFLRDIILKESFESRDSPYNIY